LWWNDLSSLQPLEISQPAKRNSFAATIDWRKLQIQTTPGMINSGIAASKAAPHDVPPPLNNTCKYYCLPIPNGERRLSRVNQHKTNTFLRRIPRLVRGSTEARNLLLVGISYHFPVVKNAD